MLVESTHYIIHNNPAFCIMMRTKVSIMRDAKARFGNVNKQHLSCGLRVQALYYFQFCFYNLCRVVKEARNLMTGEIHAIYDPFGSPRVMAYIPFHALKKDQGDSSSSSEIASMVFSKNACPQRPYLCLFMCDKRWWSPTRETETRSSSMSS